MKSCKKRVFGTLVALALLFCCTCPAFAAGGTEITPLDIIGGHDGRGQVTGEDLEEFPGSAVAYLGLHFSSGTYYATGFFVGENLILTAAHNIFNRDEGQVSSVTIKPGGVNASFASFTVGREDIFVPDTWIQGVNTNYQNDYAIIYLDGYNPTTHPGYFPLSTMADSALVGTMIAIRGFPIDKPAGTMWRNMGYIRAYTSGRFWHDVDTEDGQSGSPVTATVNGVSYTVVGIDTRGRWDAPTDYNSSTRITQEIIDRVAYARDHGVGAMNEAWGEPY